MMAMASWPISFPPAAVQCLGALQANISPSSGDGQQCRCKTKLNFVSRTGAGEPVAGVRVSKSQWTRKTTTMTTKRSSRVMATAMAGESGETALAERTWGPPIQLGTGKLPDDVDLKKFENLLYQWGSSLTQNANLPLPVPLKVDKIEGGVRIGYVKVVDAKCEDVVHIDVVCLPASEEQPKAMFVALRNGQLKDSTPPAEALIMQSLLGAVKKAVALSRPQ